MFDASEIYPNLWQGSRPPEGSALSSYGYGAVVFCANEWQPEASRYPGVKVIYAPNDDDYSRAPTRQELSLALRAAREIAQLVARGVRVLVSCQKGLNRSGLVSALALHFLTGKSGLACILSVKRCRPRALANPGFQRALTALG
jgi:protein-tyrosine phosphatase